MARISGTTALRAALGGVAGGLRGLGAMREEQRLLAQQEEARKRQAMLDERQSLMDEVMLRDKRFRPAEELAAARQPAGEALSRALSSATAMMAPGGMAAGRAPSLQAGNTGMIQQARSLAAPRERVSLGGRAFEREESEAYRTRVAGEEEAKKRMAGEAEQAQARQTEEKQINAAMRAYNMNRAQAEDYVRTGKSTFLPMTAAERDVSARGWAGIAAGKEKATADRLKEEAQPAIDKRLPVGARNSIADYNAAIRTLQEAVSQVEKNPGAFGLLQAGASKFGAVGRNVREAAEGQKSQDYTRARAQMQSALMKLRKTQFGTQMTRLEKETGEEVFPSGAESSERLMTMLEVLAGNAENLRRGVYEANNADDLYQPLTFEPVRRTAAPVPPSTPRNPYRD